MAQRSRLEPPASLVDWGILVSVATLVVTGLVSLVAGTASGAWLFVVHSVGGLVLAVLVGFKLRRVRPRVTRSGAWDRGTPVSILLAVLALAALATGVYWVFVGLVWVGPFTLLTVHMVLGLLVVPVMLWHFRHRFRWPRRAAVEREGRRSALQFGALLAGGTVFWRLQQAVVGAGRRFTGSKEAGGAGNDFPVTSWVADDPDPVDTDDWQLSVGGAVESPAEYRYDQLLDAASEAETAVLDCTSGWYAEREWRGVRVGDLLDRAGPAAEGEWVRFRSVTGYKWSVPIEEARECLLATHVGGDPLTHGHGAPLRLVAPGRRGFQWVKWVTAVDVTEREDLSQWVAIFLSGL
ncbi:MAG: molybdopterin-dependent oxidoreductase [Haloarculaceae archaeon]